MKKYIVLGITLFMLGGCIMFKNTKKTDTAIFAGGCFWCLQGILKQMDGVEQVIAGYTGGKGDNPTYKDYAKKGHVEAVKIIYDPKKISYNQLLDVFWQNIDPTDVQGQFADRGAHYRTVIFYMDEAQKQQALESKKALEKAGKFSKPIITEIAKASHFYDAEAYHQDYSEKNPIKYKLYRDSSGRDAFFKKIWGSKEKERKIFKKPSKEILKKTLTSLAYAVTQENKTEPPFKNKYWDTKDEGIYVDIVSAEPLFSSKDKFISSSGWPSFTKPLEAGNIIEKKDGDRMEVRSKQGDSHLGHVFTDGPSPTGLRYCINSAALRFIPIKDLEKEGYSKYLKEFNEVVILFLQFSS